MPEPFYPHITVQHAREALAKAEADDVAEMSHGEMAERLGELTAYLRMLLEVAEGDPQ